MKTFDFSFSFKWIVLHIYITLEVYSSTKSLKAKNAGCEKFLLVAILPGEFLTTKERNHCMIQSNSVYCKHKKGRREIETYSARSTEFIINFPFIKILSLNKYNPLIFMKTF